MKILKPTRTTPYVEIDPKTRKIKLQGRSSPENSVSFYAPIMRVLDHFSKRNSTVTIDFAFEYFNTSSGKCLFDIIRKAGKLQARGQDVQINWYYDPDDEDMLEVGEDYSDLIGIDFNFYEIT
jgi:hypothetical protein